MKNHELYEKPIFPDADFLIRVSKDSFNKVGIVYSNHWHEHMELLYFVDQPAIIHCSSLPIFAKPNSLIVINSNEVHSIESLTDSLFYYCIIVDPLLLQGSIHGAIETKYISPIIHNLIQFKNMIDGDMNVTASINRIIREYEEKQIGYELAIKSSIYDLLVLLLRGYVDGILTQREYEVKKKSLERFSTIFEFIDNNYAEKICAKQLARMLNISEFHFCHLFKNFTGKSLNEYVNSIRISKAEAMLFSTTKNISEIAASTGFNDMNYFSRLFKKYKSLSPTELRKRKTENKG